MNAVRSKTRVSPSLQWLDGALSGRIQMHISQAYGCMIENYISVVEFSCDRVRLMGKAGIMTVEGANLSLCEVRESALIVRGELRRVLFPVNGEIP